MKRLLVWLPGMVLASSAYAAKSADAHVNFTYLGVSPIAAIRSSDECYVPPTMLEGWGWQVTPEPNQRFQIKAEDQVIELGVKRIGTTDYVPLREAIKLLDGVSEWHANSDTLDVMSRVRVIRYVGGRLMITSSLKNKPNIQFLNEPNRIAVDLQGAQLSPDVIMDSDPGVQITDVKSTTVRIVVDRDNKFNIDSRNLLASKDFDFDTTPKGSLATTKPVVTAAWSTKLQFDDGDSKQIGVTLPLPHQLAAAPRFERLDPFTIRILLTGIRLSVDNDSPENPAIKKILTTPFSTGTYLTLQLAKPMGIEISSDSKSLRLQLVVPPVGNGKLAGKLIVVDAGHGGKDTGATAPGTGVLEKNLTLGIAKLLAQDLIQQGATVIMTRKSDVFISLEERAAIANRNHADLFLCVHINSNGSDRRTSGTIAFYHGSNPVSETLASCVESEVIKTSGIPAIGTWSDTKIYHSGFSVLRNTRMPGILLECGFINNSHDRKQMVRDDIQANIADAIVSGVRVYLGEPSTTKPLNNIPPPEQSGQNGEHVPVMQPTTDDEN